MHTTSGQVIGRPTGNIGIFPSVDKSPSGTEGRAFDGHCFFLPRRKRKQKGGVPQPSAMLAFGPYANPYAANFLRTSACALGLLEANSIP
ncbi:hypothetical protein [Zoogloea sp.]|uniref:hypothetical protein n=1 Tax=Zoogloea sp. TaxID=49181 RepID=UPI001416C713|nr:MAG: hypothetical protein F9K15_02785 [Zoogloea sp.]